MRLRKQQHRVTDIFIDSRAVLQRNGGHLGQVVVERLDHLVLADDDLLDLEQGLLELSGVGDFDRRR